MIIDAMDQNKLMLPNLQKSSKACADAYKLKTHLSLALDHGCTPRAYVDLFQFPHDSNHTMNVLLRTLCQRDSLPECLYLQVDNCIRENKNQFVFSLLAYLIEIEVFSKVCVEL